MLNHFNSVEFRSTTCPGMDLLTMIVAILLLDPGVTQEKKGTLFGFEGIIREPQS